METPKMPYMTLNSGKRRKRRRRSVRAALGLPPIPRQRKTTIKKGPVWGTAKRGRWKYARTNQEIVHNCPMCGKGRYRYEVECAKFWRSTPAGPQVLTSIRRGAHSKPLVVHDPCLCLGSRGQLTPRLIRLLAEGEIIERDILKHMSNISEATHIQTLLLRSEIF
jgi:hypothetical protein